jgi:hypothetical protein
LGIKFFFVSTTECGTNPEQPTPTKEQIQVTTEDFVDITTESKTENTETEVEISEQPTTEVYTDGSEETLTGNCPEVDGHYSVYVPYPGDCFKFIQCSNGFEIVHKCPANLVFDSSLNVCNYRENVDGGKFP